jgi:hypothetical protein
LQQWTGIAASLNSQYVYKLVLIVSKPHCKLTHKSLLETVLACWQFS